MSRFTVFALAATVALVVSRALCHDQSVCVPEDYSIITFGSCPSPETTTRMMTFVAPHDKSCTAPDGSLVLATTTTCHCSLAEIRPVLTECIANRQLITGYVADTNSNCSITWATSTLPNGTIDCMCTANDIGFSYTECDVETGLFMRAVSYWKRSCTYFEGSSPRLPDMRGATAPCDIRCLPGEVLRAPNAFCTNCSAGSMTNLGLTYRQPFHSLPPFSTSSCSLLAPSATSCSSWAPCADGSCLYSGNNFGVDNIESDLIFHLTVRSIDAYVQFSYMTDVEQDGDYFVVYVGDNVVGWQTGYNDWTTVSVPLIDQSATPASALCEWSVFGECIDEAQLAPYTPNFFFDAAAGSASWTFSDGFIAVMGDICNVESFANVTLQSIALVNVSSLACRVEDVLSAAIQSGTVSVLLFSSDLFAATNGHLIGDATLLPPVVATRPVAFGVISSASMVNLLIENYTSSGSSGWGSSSSSSSSSGWGSSSSSSGWGSSSSSSGWGSSGSSSSSNIFSPNVSVQYNPTPFINVVLTLSYIKDGSISERSDRISVREIVASGTSTFATSCDMCPAGFFSDPGAMECTPCPKNTFSSSAGASSCNPCPNGFAAAEGSQNCTALPPCSREHLVATHGPCTFDTAMNAEVRLVVMSLATPLMCNPSLAASLPVPEPKFIPCGSCDIGSYRDPTTHRCKQCPVGMAASASPPYCTACPSGTVAKREVVYSTFDLLNNTLPANWTASCDGCISSGFHFSTTSTEVSAISVGPGVPFGTTATLSIQDYFVSDGSFSFNYSYSLSSSAAFNPTSAATPLLVKIQIQTLDGTTSTLYYVQGPTLANINGSLQTFPKVPIPRGDRVIVISFTRTILDEVEFTISSLRLTNARSGGSQSCSRCPAGFTCPSGVESPLECSPGTAAPSGSSSACAMCASQSSRAFAQFYGQAACAQCSAGVAPIEGAQGCGPNPSCELSVLYSPQLAIPLTFNLSAFSRFTISSDEPNARAQSQLTFSLCTAKSSTSCSGASTDQSGSLTYGCVSYNSATFPIGADYAVSFSGDSSAAPLGAIDGPHLTVSFNSGPCYLDPAEPLVTLLTLRCDASPVNPSLLVSSKRFTSLKCVNDVEIVSPAFCPVCDNNSFVALQGKCDGESVTTTYFYRATGFSSPSASAYTTTPNCFGGMSLPPPKVTSCRGTVTVDLGTFGTPHIVIIVVIFVVAGLVGAIYFLFRSRNEVFNKYQALQTAEQTHAREMSVVPPPPPGSSREAVDDFTNIVTVNKIDPKD